MDLGAESGRVCLGSFDGGQREVHLFPNAPVRVVGGLHWDVLGIVREIKEGLGRAAAEGVELRSVGVDTWGGDFALLDASGKRVTNPYHYPRTEGMMERAAERVSWEELYRTTGIQFMPLNTLYQLLAFEGSPLLQAADTLLMMPDLTGYRLSGERACEYTVATTTQLYDLHGRGWARDLWLASRPSCCSTSRPRDRRGCQVGESPSTISRAHCEAAP